MFTCELASVIREASGIHFDRRIHLIKDLINYWRNDDEVALTEVDNGT